MPTVQAEKHLLPSVFIREHGIGDATQGADEATGWELRVDHPGRDTRHGCRVTNIPLRNCPFTHTLQHGPWLRRFLSCLSPTRRPCGRAAPAALWLPWRRRITGGHGD